MHFADASQSKRSVQYRAVKRHGNKTRVGIHIDEQVSDRRNAAPTVRDYPAGFCQCNDGEKENAHRIIHGATGVGSQAGVAF